MKPRSKKKSRSRTFTHNIFAIICLLIVGLYSTSLHTQTKPKSASDKIALSVLKSSENSGQNKKVINTSSFDYSSNEPESNVNQDNEIKGGWARWGKMMLNMFIGLLAFFAVYYFILNKKHRVR